MTRLTHLVAFLTLTLSSLDAVSEETKLSSRFLQSNSLAHTSPDVVLSSQRNPLENELMEENLHRQRRKLGWWGVAIFFADHAPCHGPIQPPHCHKHHHHHSSGSHSSSSSGGSSSGGSSSGGSSGGSSSGGSSSGGSSSGSSSSSWSDDGYNSGGSSSASSSAVSSSSDDGWASDGYNRESANGSPSNSLIAPGTLAFWMLLAAAASVAAAVAAMVLGSRRKEKKEYHPLRGAVEKRMKLFGGFADKCFGERQLCGADKEIEMERDGIVDNSEQNAQYRSMV